MGEVTSGADAVPVVLAVDGGGSKTDVLAIGLDGTVLAHARGPGSNPQTVGWDAARALLDELRASALDGLGAAIVRTHVYLAGMDLPAEIAVARERLAHWGAGGSGPDVIDNDLFALLRAGTLSPDAVAVVCGTGINALGVRADGATARFAALGDVSGDWGGGAWLGNRALWHAARAVDGRGPATRLSADVPAALGLASVQDVIEAFHFGRLPHHAINRLSPVLLAAADAGDTVAADTVRQQAGEIVTMAATAMRRLGMLGEHLPVVLGGGVLAAGSPTLDDAIADGLAEAAPGAEPVRVAAPPVVGAGLAALEAAGAGADALARFREELAPVG